MVVTHSAPLPRSGLYNTRTLSKATSARLRISGISRSEAILLVPSPKGQSEVKGRRSYCVLSMSHTHAWLHKACYNTERRCDDLPARINM